VATDLGEKAMTRWAGIETHRRVKIRVVVDFVGGQMQPAPAGLEQLKQRMKATWEAGDFGQIARHSAKGAEDFVASLNIRPGAEVLDVACGTGNLAIPAARTGARVTGVDIAANLLEQARLRAASEGLDVAFLDGDAEQLPGASAAFDVVMSMFGAMFAPRQEKVAAELMRVCRPGGTIAMANWTRDGMVGETFMVTAKFVPPPDGVPSPLLWGEEDVVTQRFSEGCSNVQTGRRYIAMDFPYTSKELVQFFRKYFGPTQMAFLRLDEKGQQEYAAELEKVWDKYNEGTGPGTRVAAEYLEVIATRA
jgi:ubiquinone/menaquinone biosynthesis C-methylase UbiE